MEAPDNGVATTTPPSAKQRRPELRIVNYMSPSIPIELYETLAFYLEEKLNCYATIRYESRLLERSKDHVEVLDVCAVHEHPYSEGEPVYFSDVIIHTSNSEKYREFEALRGCKWAYNDEKSLSGCLCPLYHLKLRGEKANFFGHTIESGSHQNSIRLVLEQVADAAAVDSTVLFSFLEQNPTAKQELEVITSWGPLPIYPVVMRRTLSAEWKQSLRSAFLDLSDSPAAAPWRERLQRFGVQKFVAVDSTAHFEEEHEMRRDAQNLRIHAAYY